jgi:hypothetical protein
MGVPMVVCVAVISGSFRHQMLTEIQRARPVLP